MRTVLLLTVCCFVPGGLFMLFLWRLTEVKGSGVGEMRADDLKGFHHLWSEMLLCIECRLEDDACWYARRLYRLLDAHGFIPGEP